MQLQCTDKIMMAIRLIRAEGKTMRCFGQCRQRPLLQQGGSVQHYCLVNISDSAAKTVCLVTETREAARVHPHIRIFSTIRELQVVVILIFIVHFEDKIGITHIIYSKTFTQFYSSHRFTSYNICFIPKKWRLKLSYQNIVIDSSLNNLFKLIDDTDIVRPM